MACLFEFLRVGRDDKWLKLVEPDAAPLAPGVELADRAIVRHACVVILNFRREEIDEAQGRLLAGVGDQLWEVQRFRQRHRLAIRCGQDHEFAFWLRLRQQQGRALPFSVRFRILCHFHPLTPNSAEKTTPPHSLYYGT